MSTAHLERVGSYRLVHLLRLGQTCDLWEVEKATGGDRMAMKFLPRGDRHTKEEVAFLKNEHVIGSQIEHGSVIRIFDFETVKEGTYMTLELFKHPNIKQWVHQGVEVLFPKLEQVIRRCAAGLAAMHDKGFVHRDVKPDNFLMNDEGEIKLIDFNLAKKRASGLAKLFSGRTAIQGTRSYMSPEQVRGKTVNERSD
ncbi:MAG: protein kinase, partial [Planctomycetales bacterium]|nr:protein kinase [Planctomycetales bacterium]